MAEDLFCDEQNCSRPALVFGFLSGKKHKACELHALAFTCKKAASYDISALTFMESPADAPIYERRRCIMQKGLDNLTLLETVCERDWDEGQKHLQESCEAVHAEVQRNYQEMWLKAQQCYEELKLELKGIRSRLEQLVLDRKYQLSAQDFYICELVSAEALLQVKVEDCCGSIAQVIAGNCHVLTRDVRSQSDWVERNQVEMEASADEYRKQQDAAEPQLKQEQAQPLLPLLPSTTANEAEGCLIAGQAAYQTGDFEKAVEELHRGADLLIDFEYCELYLQLRNALAETYHQTIRYQDAVSVCQHTLSTWSSNFPSYEFYRALFCLSDALIELGQDAEGYAAVEEWTEKLTPDSPRSQCEFLCIQACIFRKQGEKKQAMQLYEQAQELDQSPSFATICSRYELAYMYDSEGRVEVAEQTYLSACALFSTYYPCSYQYGICLANAAYFYGEISRPDYEEKLYKDAIKLFSVYFPHSQDYADVLHNLGVLFDQNKCYMDALQHLETAKQLNTELGNFADADMCDGYIKAVRSRSQSNC